MRPSHHAAETADGVLRIALDATATVTVGPFARGGKARVSVTAAAHDVHPVATLTPVGIFLPTWAERCLSGVTSQVPSDGLVERLAQWWESVRERCAARTTLVIPLENGPEHQSRRTQCLRRIVDVVPQYTVTVRLASSPPSQSKYTPMERCWGILEHHWNGSWLDAMDAVLQCAATMTWKGRHPVVTLVTTTSQTGVTLTKDAMEAVETPLTR